MSRGFETLSPILRKVGDRLAFCCPGCNSHHVVNVFAERSPRWNWNGSADRPTFTPSILIRTGHHVPGHDGGQCYCNWDKKDQDDFADLKCSVCHSFVIDGRIQFLGDCTHHLAGQTVDLPPFEGGRND